MSFLQIVTAITFAALLSLNSAPAQAYKYTGAVKTIKTDGWMYWQEVLLEDGDDSVGWLCNRFVKVLKNTAFTAPDCMLVSETLSGVQPRGHNTLPIGKSMWVPYIPYDLLRDLASDTTISTQTNGFRTDLSVLRAAFESAPETQLTEEKVRQLLQANNAVMEERLRQVIQDEVKAGLSNVASADAVSDLSKQVKVLVDRPVVTASRSWLWWLMLLTALVVICLAIFVYRLNRRTDNIQITQKVLKEHGKRLSGVEETLRLVVTYTARKRFNCPDLTDAKLNDLPVGQSISLDIGELGMGAVHPKVDIEKGVNDAGDEYLILVGTKKAQANQINPKEKKGVKKFTVAQVFKRLYLSIEAGEIIGVTEGRKQL